MKTMICLILDRSGSMAGRETDVIGGVNTFIQEQQKIPDPLLRSCALMGKPLNGSARWPRCPRCVCW